MRLKIVTAYNDGFSELGDLCAESALAYAAKYGYEFEAIKLHSLDRPPAWYKIKILINEIGRENIDWVLWVDADAIFKNFKINVMDYVDQKLDIHMVKHRCPVGPLKGADGLWLYAERPNTGVMVVKKSDWSARQLDKIWNATQYLNHKWWEQAAVHDLMGYHFEISGGSRSNMPNSDFLSHVGWLPAIFNSVPTPTMGVPAHNEYDPVIVHFAGMENSERLFHMQKIAKMHSWRDSV